jgi:uncharacterized membrane protein
MTRMIPLIVLFLFSLIVIPAYAEVVSLKTDRALYAIDMNVYFTGTVDNTDSQKLVNLLVKDPNGKIVLMTGKFAAHNDTFQITINTNDPSQFNLTGTYQATAFVNNANDGKTIFFDFSPNGLPIVHQTVAPKNNTQSLQNTITSNNITQSLEQNQNKSALHENMSTIDTGNKSKVIPSVTDNVKQYSSGYDLENVIYPVMIVCGVAIVGFIAFHKIKTSKTKSKSKKPISEMTDTDHDDYAMAVLKNRLAKGEITIEEFKATKDALGEP